MAGVHRIAPIFGVRNVDAALAFYTALGFATRIYAPTHEYGFATWGEVEIHLGGVGPNSVRAPSSAYLFVTDADALAKRWRSAGADVRGPDDTEWGMHEGVVIDPDGNIIRFGTPMTG